MDRVEIYTIIITALTFSIYIFIGLKSKSQRYEDFLCGRSWYSHNSKRSGDCC